MTVLQVLRKSRALVAKGWTKYALARNASGRIVDVHSKSACSFCMDGSLRRVADARTSVYRRSLAALSGVLGGLAPEVNDLDETTKADVLRAFDRAIAKAGGR